MPGTRTISHLDLEPTCSVTAGGALASLLSELTAATQADAVALWAGPTDPPAQLLGVAPPDLDVAGFAPLSTRARLAIHDRAGLWLCQVRTEVPGGWTVDLVLGRRQRPWVAAEIEGWLTATATGIALAAGAALERENVMQSAILGERERLAHELHDGPAQALLYVSMEVHLLERAVQRGDLERARNAAERIRAELSSLYREFRAAIADLNVRTALTHGLVCAAEQLVDRLQRCGIQAELLVEDPAWAVPPVAEVQALRVLQEALGNVQRHAQARRCTVRLGRRHGRCFLEVVDDGQGFEPRSRGGPAHGRFGLHVMNERVRSVGGTLRVTSAVGRGTRVTAVFPAAG